MIFGNYISYTTALSKSSFCILFGDWDYLHTLNRLHSLDSNAKAHEFDFKLTHFTL